MKLTQRIIPALIAPLTVPPVIWAVFSAWYLVGGPSAPDYDYRYMLKDVISACMVATPLAFVASFAVGVRAARSLEAEGKFSFLRAASLGALVGGGCLVLVGLLMLPEVFRPLPFAGALFCGATTATVFWAVWRRC